MLIQRLGRHLSETDLFSRLRDVRSKVTFPNVRLSIKRLMSAFDSKVRKLNTLKPPAKPVTPPPRAPRPTPIVPDGTRIYAIGDVHGRADLLEMLLIQISDDCDGFEGEAILVFLGDYVDRGLESSKVIDHLLQLRERHPQSFFLRGNHEEAMLNFLKDYSYGPKWANYGGRETLVSYGVRPPRSLALGEDWVRAHTEFKAALSSEHELFLKSLITHIEIAGFGFVHAGVRPGVPFDEQTDHDRLWIRDDFLSAKSMEDRFIVHGHTPTDVPYVDGRRIGIDTGAYFTGRLTAVRLEGENVDFISTSL